MPTTFDANHAMPYRSSRLNRRTLGGAALAATLIGAAPARTLAQDATPAGTASPVAKDGWDLSAINFTMETVVNGLDQPLWVVSPPADQRLFIVNRTGTVVIVQDGKLVEQPFIDVSDRIITDGQEQGLLGLAFHPDYAKNGAFYLFYTSAKDTSETLSRFNVTGDPNVADPTSEVVQLNQPDKYANHNGGCVIFGPDGYLYTGIGDGGSAGDPDKNGQNLSTWLGTLMRIDPDPTAPAGETQYAIPDDNPFANKEGAKPEIWAYGLRNPWRFSFDRETGDLWIGDVGQNQWEEIDFQPADSKGGTNYGWSIKEATHCFQADSCSDAGLTDPVAEYGHDVGVSVTGGYVYRGSAIPDLVGTYLFADYGTGRIWGLLPKGDGTFAMSAPVETGLNITSFGEDSDGELYISVFDQGGGSVMQFVPGS